MLFPPQNTYSKLKTEIAGRLTNPQTDKPNILGCYGRFGFSFNSNSYQMVCETLKFYVRSTVCCDVDVRLTDIPVWSKQTQNWQLNLRTMLQRCG